MERDAEALPVTVGTDRWLSNCHPARTLFMLPSRERNGSDLKTGFDGD